MEQPKKGRKNRYHTPQDYALSMLVVGVAAATLGGITQVVTKSKLAHSAIFGGATFVGYTYIPEGALRTATLIGGGTLTGMNLAQAIWHSMQEN